MTETKTPSIPTPAHNLIGSVEALKQLVEVREGRRGDPLDAFVSYRHLRDYIVTDETIVTFLGLAHDHTIEHITPIDSSRMLGRGSAGSGDAQEMVLSSDYGVTFTYAASSLKVNTPQDLQATASPSFVRATLTQATGTAPLTISSTTVCTNLNADLWDGYQFADYLDQAVKQASSPTFVTVKLSGLTDGYVPYHVSDATGLANSIISTDGSSITIDDGAWCKAKFLSAGMLGSSLEIGTDDTLAGGLTLYGDSGSDRGGWARLYISGAHDTTNQYFGIDVYENYLQMGPNLIPNAVKVTEGGDLFVTAGTISCSDLTDGYVPYHVSDAAGLANSIISVTANDITVAGDIKLTATKKLYLDTGGDTYIHEVSADKVEVFVGGVELITLIEAAQDEVRINEDGGDVDFTVEASGVADALVVQGSDGQVTLGALTAGFVKSSAGGVLSVDTATYLNHTLFDAHTILYATVDDTPLALTVTEQTLVGRLTGGNITAVAIGIADNNIVQIDQADAADNDYVKFTAGGVEGRSYAEVLADLSGQATGAFNFNTQAVTVGSLLVGADDTSYGSITAYGDKAGSTKGGELKVYTAADYDGTISYFWLRASEDDFLLGPDTDSDAFKLTSDKDLYLTDGDAYFQSAGASNIILDATNAYIFLGRADAKRGIYHAYGAAAGDGDFGGSLFCSLADDHNAVISAFAFMVHQDDLLIGPDTDTDALKLDSNKDLYLTDGDWYVQYGGANRLRFYGGSNFGILYLGQEETVRGQIQAFGNATGSNQGANAIFHLALDYKTDALLSYYEWASVEDDFYLQTNSLTFFTVKAERYYEFQAVRTAPSSISANTGLVWFADINGAAGKCGMYMMAESGTDPLIVAGVQMKTDTGDPANVHEGKLVINTFDNTAKLYADGAWRQLATW